MCILILCILIKTDITSTFSSLKSRSRQTVSRSVDLGERETNCNTAIRTEHMNTNKFNYTDPTVVKQIYRLLYITDKILNENNVEYFADGGTLLGMARNHGLIPWDDDADIQIWETDECKFKNLSSKFAEYNLVIAPEYFGYKIYDKDNYMFPTVDVFVMKVDSDGKVIYKSPKAQHLFGHCYHMKNDLYPLRRYVFGSINLVGSSLNSATEYLNRCYGNDWNDYAYQQYDHKTNKTHEKIKVKLDNNDKRPAQPIYFTIQPHDEEEENKIKLMNELDVLGMGNI